MALEHRMRWCKKPAVGRVGGSVEKLPLDTMVMVYENHRWTGARWYKKTTVGWVGGGV